MNEPPPDLLVFPVCKSDYLSLFYSYLTVILYHFENENKNSDSPKPNLKSWMKAQNQIEASRHSIASRWTCRCSQWMISRFSLWIPPPTHCSAAPSARQGRQCARKLCWCGSNSGGSEVLRAHRQFDNTICMPTMLGPSAWICISQVELWASLTHRCFSCLVKWWNGTSPLTGGPSCMGSHAYRQVTRVSLLFVCFFAAKKKKKAASW